jgi:PAS domain S-box-containing protein
LVKNCAGAVRVLNKAAKTKEAVAVTRSERTSIRREVLTWTLAGACFGLLFPLVATWVAFYPHDWVPSLSALLALHRGSHTHLIIDTAPFFLGIFGGLIGYYRGREKVRFHQLERELSVREQKLFGVSETRKTLESRLAREEHRRLMFQLAIEQSDDGFVILDPDHRIHYTNHAFAAMHGYEIDELLGRSQRAVHTETQFSQELEPFYRSVLSNGASCAEIGHLHRDGTEFPCCITATNLKNSAGELLGVAKIVRDVSKQKQAAEELRRSRQKLISLVNAMQEGVVFADEQGVVQTVNPCFCDLVGLSPDLIVGRSIAEMHGSRLRERIEKMIDGLKRGGGIVTMERTIGERHYVLRIQPVRDGKSYLGTVLNVHDMTAQREARLAAEEAAQAKTAFLANISHEIRTPMNGILGMLDILSSTSLNAEQRKFLQTIQSSADGLLEILNQVLDFSKNEAGRTRLEKRDFAVGTLIEDLEELMKGRLAGKALRLQHLVDRGVPRWLRGDEMRLRQILLNLLANAVKFTTAGTVALHVTLERPIEDRPWIRFAVRDTGIGISEEKRKRLFKPFSQVDDSTTRRYGGTGLGLAICRQLVEMMGGRIGVDSVKDEGSTFWFVVPLEMGKPVRRNPRARSSTRRMVCAGGRKPRILVAEDSRVNQEVARRLLEKLGCTVEIAGNGRQALAAIQHRSFDLVFMDIQMPELDGVEATQKLRTWEAREGEGMHHIVVAMTAHAMQGDREKCLQAGMDDYVAKPVKRAALKAMLKKYTQLTPAAQAPTESATQSMAERPQGPSESATEVPRASAAGSATEVPRASTTETTTEAAVAEPTAAAPSDLKNPQSISTVQPFSMERALESVGGDDDLLRQVTALYLEEIPQYVDTVKQALALKDTDAMRRAAHTLKGSAGNFGATQTRKLAARIEHLCRDGEFQRAEKLVPPLLDEVDRFQNALRAVVAPAVQQTA